MIRADDQAAFSDRGVIVLRGVFSPGALLAEVDQALRDGCLANVSFVPGQSGSYCPMLGLSTPESVALVDRFAAVATLLLGRRVLPARAKAVHYVGESGWHVDSTGGPPSVGFLAYLSPLHADTGALRVRPGSHRDPDALADVVLETTPGDVVVMDERVAHASFGGRDRRQWRIDYVVDPTPSEEEAVRAYYAAIFPERARPPYNTTRYPSYGPAWISSDRPWVATMRKLGVFDAAAAHEAE